MLNVAGLVLAPTAGNNSVICQHFTGDHVLQIAYIVQAARLWTLISIQTWSRQLNIYGLGHIFTPSTLTLFIHTTYNMLNIIIYLYRVDTLCLGTFSCWRFFRFYVMFVVYLTQSISVALAHGDVTWDTSCPILINNLNISLIIGTYLWYFIKFCNHKKPKCSVNNI